MEKILYLMLIGLGITGCRDDSVRNSVDLPIPQMPSVTLSILKANLKSDTAEFSWKLELSNLNGLFDNSDRYCRLGYVKYFASNSQFEFDDLRWNGSGEQQEYVSNSLSNVESTSLFLTPHDAGIDPDKDKYLFFLVMIKDGDNVNTLYKTWVMAEINWKTDNPNQRVDLTR